MTDLKSAMYADLKAIINGSRSLILSGDQIAQIQGIAGVCKAFGFVDLSAQIDHVLELDRLYHHMHRLAQGAKIAQDFGPTVDLTAGKTR